MVRTGSDKKTQVPGSRRTEGRFERRQPVLKALARLIEACGNAREVKPVAELLLTTIMEGLKVTRASLYVVAPGQRRLELYRSFGIEDGPTPASLPVESDLLRRLSEAVGPVHLDDHFLETEEAASEEEEEMRPFVEAGLFSAMGLAVDGNLLGALFYRGAAAGETFDALDEEILGMSARVASIAIRNVLVCRTAVTSKLALERFSDMKRACIGRTSQEMQTPIMVLKSALWSLEPDQADEGVLLDMAKDAVTRLQGKIESLLSLNEIELDRSDFRLEPSEISSIVEDALREILPELEEKQVRVDIDDRARFRKVLVDSGKITVVIRSIIGHAVDAVGRGGNITITIRESKGPAGPEEGIAIAGVEHGPRREDGASHLVITVRDDGIGITDTELMTLAEPFPAVPEPIDHTVAGLGFGLLVSQKVVVGHGGKMYCRSNLGWGTQFSIWLPLEA